MVILFSIPALGKADASKVVSSLDVCSGTEFKHTSNLEAFVFR